MAEFTSHTSGTFSWPAHIPSCWMPYFQIASRDASTAKAKELGGKVIAGSQDMPNTGRFTIVSDPQGSMFAVFKCTERK